MVLVGSTGHEPAGREHEGVSIVDDWTSAIGTSTGNARPTVGASLVRGKSGSVSVTEFRGVPARQLSAGRLPGRGSGVSASHAVLATAPFFGAREELRVADEDRVSAAAVTTSTIAYSARRQRETVDVLEDITTAEPNFGTLRSLMPTEASMDNVRSRQALLQQQRELDSASDKQDLFISQWKIVRNQTGVLTQQLLEMQKQIQDVSTSTSMAINKVDSQLGEAGRVELRVKGFVRQLFESLEQSINRVKHEQDVMTDRRVALEAEVFRRLDQVSEDISKAFDKNGQPLDSEVRKLRVELQEYKTQAPALKQFMQRSADDMKQSWEQMLEHHRKVKDSLDLELRQRQQAQDDLHHKMLNLVEKERGERDLSHGKLCAQVCSMQEVVASHKEELPWLRGKLMELEETLRTNPQGHAELLESRLSLPMERIKEMERRVDNVQASINQESSARTTLAEVFDQMLVTERTKMTNLVTQKAAFARRECEDIAKSMHDRIEKERAEREAALEGCTSGIAHHKSTVMDRVTHLESISQCQVQKCQSMVTEVREMDLHHRKLEDQLVACMRDMKRELQAAITEEQAKRTQAINRIEEQINFIGEHHDMLRDLFVSKGPRSVVLASASTSASTKLSATPSPFADLGASASMWDRLAANANL